MCSPSECRIANTENESDTNVDITVSHMTFVMAVEQNTNMDSYQNLEIFKCNIAADFSESTFEDSSSSINSQEFDEPCTLQAVQERLRKLNARKSELKHEMNKFRHEACGGKGRKKRCLIIIKKARFRYRWSVTRKEGQHVKALGQKL